VSQSPVQLAVLGPFRLQAAGEPIAKGLRRKAAELMAYLAVYPDDATTDALPGHRRVERRAGQHLERDPVQVGVPLAFHEERAPQMLGVYHLRQPGLR
jgi:hypothetical protein